LLLIVAHWYLRFWRFRTIRLFFSYLTLALMSSIVAGNCHDSCVRLSKSTKVISWFSFSEKLSAGWKHFWSEVNGNVRNLTVSCNTERKPKCCKPVNMMKATWIVDLRITVVRNEELFTYNNNHYFSVINNLDAVKIL